jgi:hypothetical protein
MVVTAKLSAFSKALRVALVTAADHLAGRRSNPFSMGVPMTLVILAARLGCSRRLLA